MTILERALRVGETKKFKEFERKVARIGDFEPREGGQRLGSTRRKC